MHFPNISERTNAYRVRFLNKKGIDSFDDWEKLQDAYAIVNALSPAPTTRKTEMFHLIGYLKMIPDASELLKEYEHILPTIIKNSDKHTMDNRFENDPRSDRYIDLDLLKEAWDKLPDSQDKVLLGLYINEPPQRNVYYDANIIHKKADVDPKKNNIIITSRSIRAYIPKHKTSRTYGPIDFAFSKKTSDLIRKVGFPSNLSEDAFKKRLKNAGNRLLGQPITIDSYRHIWEIKMQSSEEYRRMTSLQREKMHNKIMHSTQAALLYNRV